MDLFTNILHQLWIQIISEDEIAHGSTSQHSPPAEIYRRYKEKIIRSSARTHTPCMLSPTAC